MTLVSLPLLFSCPSCGVRMGVSCGASNHLCCNMPHKWSSQEATQSKPLIFPRSIIVEQSEVAGWMALSPISSSILAADLSLAMRPSGWTETQSRRVDRAEPGGILQVGCGRGGAAACPDTLGICLAVSRTFGGQLHQLDPIESTWVTRPAPEL